MAATAWLPKELEVLIELIYIQLQNKYLVHWMDGETNGTVFVQSHFITWQTLEGVTVLASRNHSNMNVKIMNTAQSVCSQTPPLFSVFKLKLFFPSLSPPLSSLFFLHSPHSYHLFTHLSWSTHIPLHPSPHLSGNLSWVADSYVDHFCQLELVFLFTAWPDIVQVSECSEASDRNWVLLSNNCSTTKSRLLYFFLHGTLSSW